MAKKRTEGVNPKTTKKGVRNVSPHARAGKIRKSDARALAVAQGMLAGKTRAEIAEEEGLSERQVQRIKNSENCEVTFQALLDRSRADLIDLWDETIAETKRGLSAQEGLIQGGGDEPLSIVFVADHRTRQLAVRNGVTLFQMIFNRKKDDGPMTITLENARQLLAQLRAKREK